jgi:hypothetical protein
MLFSFFKKLENWKAEQVLPGGLEPVGKGGCGERVWEGKYGANVVYTCM